MSTPTDKPTSTKEWQLLEKLLFESHREQRRARRWGIFFKCLIFVYIFAGLALFYARIPLGVNPGSDKEHVGLVRVNGVIAADQEASANRVVTGLRRAFEADNTTAILLSINSPGGSPVQSGYINDEIYRLKALYPEKKVYAVIADIGASGAYYIAVAADEIYADKASLVGSIGVTAAGFGFVGLLEKLGVERRSYTSGENKGFLDPFSPENPDQVAFWQDVLGSTHEQFIDVVKTGRGDKLAAGDEVFSGLVWNGEQALELGLIDGLASAGRVARDIIGTEDIVNYSVVDSPLRQLIDGFGVSVGEGIAGSVLTEQDLSLY